MKEKITIIKTIQALSLLAAVILTAFLIIQSYSKNLPSSSVKLIFNEKDEAILPKGYRSWVHTYSAWESITITPLDNTLTKTPEFHNVYVEPNAYRTFLKTGAWPEGTLIAKEFSMTSINTKNCDGPPAYVCNIGGSKVIFSHGAIGLSLMLKDSKRYPNEPGGWAYFSFGHQTPPYEKTSPARERSQCAQCHIDHVGPQYDYIWSFKLNQPGFQRHGDTAKLNLEAAFPR
ncbi:cytochrome P460 family protein [Pseudomonas aeruginosa]